MSIKSWMVPLGKKSSLAVLLWLPMNRFGQHQRFTTPQGILYSKPFGKFTYAHNGTDMSLNTLFDLASVTKVLATTTSVAQFYQRGELNLHSKIWEFFPDFKQNHKENITVWNCMLHNTGFPPDPIPSYASEQFGCPETKKKRHPDLSYSCQDMIKAEWLKQTLINPTGKKYVYSDLSMITMHFVLGQLAKQHGYVTDKDLLPGCPNSSETCYYEAYVRKYVIDFLKLKKMRFLPPYPQYKDNCAPAWYDHVYRHEQIQGFVSDGNSYANGGIAGHAGLFSNILDIGTLLSTLMFQDDLVNHKTMELFTTVKDVSQSSRALGWDTNALQDSTCEALSKTTYLHTGYTGTQVCNDPVRKMFTVLLTNRCYPDDQQKSQILELRRKFNKQVQIIYDKHF